jgi:NitT/TauT family transport system substrate-binding protein
MPTTTWRIARTFLSRSSLATVAAGLLLGTAACGGSGQQTAGAGGGAGDVISVKIGVAAPTAEQSLPAVARDLGIFTKHGIDASIELIPGGPQITAGLIGESLQFGVYSAPAPEVAAVQGAAIKYVGVWCHRANLGLVVAPGIGSVGELAGQPIAVSAPGTTTALYTDMVLRGAGLDSATGVVRRNVGSQGAALNAFASGQVKAAIFGAPVTYTAVASVPGATIQTDFSTQDYAWPYAGMVATDKYAQQNRGTVEKVIAALREAAAAYKDPALTSQVLTSISQFTHTTDQDLVRKSFDSAAAQMDLTLRPVVADHRNVIEQLAFSTPQAAGFDPAKIVDMSFTEATGG